MKFKQQKAAKTKLLGKKKKKEQDRVRDELSGKLFEEGSYFLNVGAKRGGGGGDLT